MPWSLGRFQEARGLHFITFSCYHRKPLLSPSARDIFEQTLERTRQWYGFYISAYVVMPEHVHLLVTEPERAKLSVALQMLKQNVAKDVKSQLPTLSQRARQGWGTRALSFISGKSVITTSTFGARTGSPRSWLTSMPIR